MGLALALTLTHVDVQIQPMYAPCALECVHPENIVQNHQIVEHFERSPAYSDFKAGKLYFRM